jgi:hypothetical protein
MVSGVAGWLAGCGFACSMRMQTTNLAAAAVDGNSLPTNPTRTFSQRMLMAPRDTAAGPRLLAVLRPPTTRVPRTEPFMVCILWLLLLLLVS